MAAVMEETLVPVDPARTLMDVFLSDMEQLQRYFRSRVRAQEDARDLVQDVCLRVMGIPQDRPIENSRAYLWSIAHSIWCQHLERNGRAAPVDIEEPSIEAQLAEEPDEAAGIDSDQRSRKLHAILEQLPMKTQWIMQLKWRDGLRYEEIAVVVGLSIDGVKKHLKKGMRHCRERVDYLD